MYSEFFQYVSLRWTCQDIFQDVLMKSSLMALTTRRFLWTYRDSCLHCLKPSIIRLDILIPIQAAQSEAGKKGAAISAGRSEEDRKAAGQKAAETRYAYFSSHMDVCD